jgi:hypothetical protein
MFMWLLHGRALGHDDRMKSASSFSWTSFWREAGVVALLVVWSCRAERALSQVSPPSAIGPLFQLADGSMVRNGVDARACWSVSFRLSHRHTARHADGAVPGLGALDAACRADVDPSLARCHCSSRGSIGNDHDRGDRRPTF